MEIVVSIGQRDKVGVRPFNDPQIYRDLMRFKPPDLSANAWAVTAGVSRTVWADMRRHGNPSRRVLEKLLAVANSSLAEFEALRLGHEPAKGPSSTLIGDKQGWEWNPGRLPNLPLLGTALAGDWGEPGSGIGLTEVRTSELVARLARPPSLANDVAAYGLTIVGDSMWPRFRPGRRIAISPRLPVAPGDDVVVRLRASGDRVPTLIKELVARAERAIELRQFNPDVSFCVDGGEVEAVHKVVGELI